MSRIAVSAACVLLAVTPAAAQQTSGQQQTPQPPQALRYEEQVEVVAVTPVHGVGLAKLKVPANVQVFTLVPETGALPLDMASILSERAASVQIRDAHGGTFQPDVSFRGFMASPLLGASEGLAVYQNGVRINEPFGDTINWDALPVTAIASVNVMPGSNPLFGLNALGGALSIRTKSGFDVSGHRVTLSTGSFGRHLVEAESGGHGDRYGYYVAGTLTDEAGWRDFSPSTIRRLFGDFGWRADASSLNVSVTAASNDLTGTGAAPIDLLEQDRDAVFTYPDRTDHDLGLVNVRGTRQLSAQTWFEAVAYYRASRIGTFNGDAADADEDDEDDDDDGREFDAVNNISRTRGRGAGATAQLTRTGPLRGRDNHFIAGAGFDTATTRFDFAAELAELTPDRGTSGAGVFDEEAFVDLRARTLTVSAFATNTWSLTTKIAVTTSARFNRTTVRLRDQIGVALNGDHSFGRLNPAAGMTYQARPWLNVFASYSESSRVPTPVELTCADPADPCRLPNAFVSDPPLNQIVGRTWEAGLRGTSAPLEWSLAAFASQARDDIVFVSSGTLRGQGHFENVPRTRRRGIEASVEYSLATRMTLFGAYTLQQATFGAPLRMASRFHPEARLGEIQVRAGDRLPGVPRHSAKASLTARLTGRLSAALAAQAQSGQFLRGDEANLLPPLSAFLVINAQARHRLTKRLSAVLQAQNLFDAAFSTFGTLGDPSLLGDEFTDPRFFSPGAPRAMWVGLELQF
ncbi:MAG: TonB-dependent receptor [Acidobacteria bacterium]|nr:TonB-dependent receptor [Acidobacteriota bacterium]